MKNFLIAIGLSVALPALAQAQTKPAPAPKADCRATMQGMPGKGMDHSKMDHSKMDPSKMDHCGMAKDAKPGADPHAGHAMSKPGKADKPATDAKPR